MTQLQSEKYNVAWFKLAEFILRGEKERALGIYKLLAHSMQDQALAIQLKADILLSFDDQRAFEEYILAAQIYQKQKKFIQAASIYEHLNELKFEIYNNLNFLLNLIALYVMLDYPNKIYKLSQKIACFIENQNFSNFEAYLNGKEFLEEFSLFVKLKIQKACSIALCQKEDNLEPYVYHLIEQIIKNSNKLKVDNKEFFSKLKNVNEIAYEYAVNYKFRD